MLCVPSEELFPAAPALVWLPMFCEPPPEFPHAVVANVAIANPKMAKMAFNLVFIMILDLMFVLITRKERTDTR